MDDNTHILPVPAGWLEALSRSDEDLAVGRTVAAEIVLRDLRESLVRLESKPVATATLCFTKLS
jgi:hypothetical protein